MLKKKKIFKLFITSIFLFSIFILFSCANIKKQSQNEITTNHKIEITNPGVIVDEQKYKTIEKIYEKNQLDKRSVAEFLSARTLNIHYPSEILEIYNVENDDNKLFTQIQKIENATAWIIDKDPSNDNSYYLATNIHAIKNLLSPIFYTNSNLLLKETKKNYKQVDLKIIDSLNEELNSSLKFKYNFEEEIPYKVFSKNWKPLLYFDFLKDDQKYNNKINFDFQEIKNKVENIYNKRVKDFLKEEDNNINNNDLTIDKIESLELINSTFYDFNFWDFSKIENNKIFQENIKNVSSDFAIFKIKLKDGLIKDKPFQEYDSSPTLIDWVQPKIGNEIGDKISSFSFPFKKDSFRKSNNKKYFTNEYFENQEIIKSIYKDEIKIKNGQYYTKDEYKDNIKFQSKKLEIETWWKNEKTAEIEKKNFSSNNQDIELYTKLDKMNEYHIGSSGAGIFNLEKMAVGIFFSSNSKKFIEDVEQQRDNLILDIYPLLTKEPKYNVIENYLKSRNENNSWLKKHWNEIQMFVYKKRQN